MRVAGAAGAVPEPGGDEPRAGQSAGAEVDRRALGAGPVVRPATHETGLALQPSQRRVDGTVVGGDDDGLDQWITQGVEH